MTLVDVATLTRQLGGSLPPDVELGGGRVLSVSPGQRAVIAFETEAGGRPGPELIAKAYADAKRATRLHSLLSTLPGVPRPVAHLPAIGTCVYEASHGQPLDQLAEGRRADAVAAAAEWLAMLHQAEVRFDRTLDLAREMEALGAWTERVAAEVPACGAKARELRDRLRAATGRVETTTARPMHKDFHYQHTLFEDGRMVVIDLDEMRSGEPMVDVAHFAANLRLLERRQGTVGLETSFVAGYRALTGVEPDRRHRFWLAHTFLKVAKQLVRGRGPSPVPTGDARAREVEFALAEGLRCLDG